MLYSHVLCICVYTMYIPVMYCAIEHWDNKSRYHQITWRGSGLEIKCPFPSNAHMCMYWCLYTAATRFFFIYEGRIYCFQCFSFNSSLESKWLLQIGCVHELHSLAPRYALLTLLLVLVVLINPIIPLFLCLCQCFHKCVNHFHLRLLPPSCLKIVAILQDFS